MRRVLTVQNMNEDACGIGMRWTVVKKQEVKSLIQKKEFFAQFSNAHLQIYFPESLGFAC